MSSSHEQTMNGVSDDVAHVSITSGSPTNPPGAPRLAATNTGGVSEDDPIGRWCSTGITGYSKSTVPFPIAADQTGNVTPKNRWRLMHQSPLSPSIHDS